MANAHPTAIIHAEARLHESVEVGPYAVIGPHVRIGAGSVVGPHTVIEGHTRIGEKNRIFQFASIGAVPQDLKYAGEPTELVIGDGNQIREFTTLNLGTAGGGGVTRVGNGNLLMAYVHVAHDCVVGNGNVFANGATLAGHVTVEDRVIIGGLVAVHQFARLGSFAFIAGGAMVTLDVAPYCTAQGDRAELAGLNTIGLQRAGFTEEQIGRIKEAYRVLFRAKLGLADAVAKLKTDYAGAAEIERLVKFVEGSERGLTR